MKTIAIKGNRFTRYLAKILREKGLTVEVRTTRGDADIPELKKDVRILTRIYGRWRNGDFIERERITMIKDYETKHYKKIVKILHELGLGQNYTGGHDEYEAFIFVGVWENEGWY